MRTATVYNFLLEATLMASIAILLMIPIRLFLRKKLGSRAIAFAWLLVAIRLLCPITLPNPAINEIRSPFANDQAIRPIAGQVKVRVSDAIHDVYFWAQDAAGRENAVVRRLDDLMDSTYSGMLSIRLMQAYVVGAGVVLGWFVLSNLRFRRRLKADRIEPISGELLEAYHALCAQRKVNPVPVWFVDPLPSACLMGVIRPYIALPLTAKPQQAEQVLAHEICHYEGRHHWLGVLRLCCCVVHWFNPLVWAAAHMSRTDLELACDDRVVQNLSEDERRSYASVLVLAAAKRDLPGVAVLSTGMSMTGRKLKKRVNGILQKAQRSRALAAGFAVLACMALVAAFATAEYFPPLQVKVSASADIQLAHREITSEQEACAYAQEIWQHEYVQAETEGLILSAEYRDSHFEVTASDENGPALVTGFLDDGTVIYLCDLSVRATEMISVENPRYENKPEEVEKLMTFGVTALEALNPGISKELHELTAGGEGETEGRISLHFMEYGAEDQINRTFRVMAHPQIRLIYYADLQHMSWDDTDRLEPGNG